MGDSRIAFRDVAAAFRWLPIRDCPGRSVARDVWGISPLDLVIAADVAVVEHNTTTAKDVVLVAEFEGGGLICYRRKDGTMCYTLNTVEAMTRKLRQLGIPAGGA